MLSFAASPVQLNQDFKALVRQVLEEQDAPAHAELLAALKEETADDFYELHATEIPSDQIAVTPLGGFAKPGILVDIHRSAPQDEYELEQLYRVMVNARSRVLSFMQILTKLDPQKFVRDEFYYRTSDGVHLLKAMDKWNNKRLFYQIALDDSLWHSIEAWQYPSASAGEQMAGTGCTDHWSGNGGLDINAVLIPASPGFKARVNIRSSDLSKGDDDSHRWSDFFRSKEQD